MEDFNLHIRQVLCHADQVPFVPGKVGRHVEVIVAETDSEGLQRAIAKQNEFAKERGYRPNILAGEIGRLGK